MQQLRFIVISIVVITALVQMQSCGSKNKTTNGKSDTTATTTPTETFHNAVLVAPKAAEEYTIGEFPEIEFSLINKELKPDSIQLLINGKISYSSKSLLKFNADKPFSTVGNQNIKLLLFYGTKGIEQIEATVLVLSDVKPKQFGYSIVKTYPHDVHAYTQGLIYDNGQLLESTGLTGKSSVRRVDLESGQVLQQTNLSSDVFGEGIAVVKNRIYQVTWQSQVGFIFDKESLALINKFNYTNAEGWGLTSDDKQFIFSDGSNIIRFMDLEYFSEKGRIEVCDDEDEIDRLNELELIDGQIYANVYGSDNIVIIDPVSGKVTAKIDLSGLLKKSERNKETDVLNGIAYDQKGKRLFVTGKNWPNLYEIKLVPKK